MAEIVLKKGTVISHTELETNEVVIFADEITGSLKKMNHLGDVVTFSEGLTLEQIEDMLGNSFEDSATVAFVYTDALSSPFSAFVKQDGLDHTQIQNVGANTHAQIDSHLANTSNPHGVTIGQIGAESAGALASHVALNDPHTQYLKEVDAANNFAPISHGHIVSEISDFDLEVEQKIVSTIFDGNGIISSYDNVGHKLTINVDQTELSHLNFQGIGTNTHAQIDSHLANTSNPHGVTVGQIGAEIAGTASTLMSNHVGQADPHTQYAKESTLATVATSGNYTDLSNTPSIIPFINLPSPNASGQFLVWDSVAQKFKPTTGGWAFATDTQPTSGQLLQYTLTGSRFNLTNVSDVLSSGNISDLANVTNDSPTNGQVLTYDSTQGAWKPSANASSNIFGSEFQEQTRDTFASTTSTTPLLYTGITKAVPAGKYRIGAFIIWNLATTTSNFICDLKINGVTIGSMSIEANEAGIDIRTPSSGFFYYTVTSAQSLDIEIYFRPEVNGITARMYFATLEFWRVS